MLFCLIIFVVCVLVVCFCLRFGLVLCVSVCIWEVLFCFAYICCFVFDACVCVFVCCLWVLCCLLLVVVRRCVVLFLFVLF